MRTEEKDWRREKREREREADLRRGRDILL